MESQIGDTRYFHRFVRWYAALQGLLALALVLAASSASAVMTDSPRDIAMHAVAAIVRTVLSWLKSNTGV
jgi:hypothetical protein